jgi:hypothetical protein
MTPATPRSGRIARVCAFCKRKSWAGRTDLSGMFLCEACCQRGEKILKARRSEKGKR